MISLIANMLQLCVAPCTAANARVKRKARIVVVCALICRVGEGCVWRGCLCPRYKIKPGLNFSCTVNEGGTVQATCNTDHHLICLRAVGSAKKRLPYKNSKLCDTGPVSQPKCHIAGRLAARQPCIVCGSQMDPTTQMQGGPHSTNTDNKPPLESLNNIPQGKASECFFSLNATKIRCQI